MRRLGLMAALAACLMAMPALAQDARPLRLVAFAGASNWPVWIGAEQGFFAREKLAVSLAITPNSRQMAADLMAGRFDIALTSIDNVVAYVEGQGEEPLPEPADFVAFLGVDDGMLSLMAVPGFATVADLRGKTLSVDALTTGFAFVLREALERAGMGHDDVRIVAVGGGAQRLAALNERRQDATLLNAPLDILAEVNGARRLADMRASIGPYQGISAAARRSWLANERQQAIAFARAFRASIDWLCQPANRGAAIAILRARMPGLSDETAARIHERLTDPERGIKRDLAIDIEGLRTVLRLRSKFAAARQPLTEPDRYLDLTIRRDAFAAN